MTIDDGSGYGDRSSMDGVLDGDDLARKANLPTATFGSAIALSADGLALASGVKLKELGEPIFLQVYGGGHEPRDAEGDVGSHHQPAKSAEHAALQVAATALYLRHLVVGVFSP